MNTSHRTVLGSVLVVLSFILLAAPVSAQTPPTATEAFNLRRQCKKLSDEKAQEVAEGNSAFHWELFAAWNTSKYDPMSNRCYGRIYVHIVKPSHRLDHEHDQVFDLQTDDLLATADIENGKKHGSIFDPDYTKPWLPLCRNGCPPDFGDQTWKAAEDYMNEFMADPRR
jgi:hypothetical protein